MRKIDTPGHTANRELILLEVLAIDRTVLANERTLLSYLRTTLALLAGGGSLIQFISAWWALPFGSALLVAGVALLLFGMWRYRRVKDHLRQVWAPTEDS
jgi:putative membrane protein